MLNSKKLIYILPDLAYVAELLPSKKPHEFNIQNFRQINGEFLDDNVLIDANLGKLFKKLDEEEYDLILPDFLFTNTILNVEESSEAKVEAHIKEKVLKDLGLSDETHYVQHFVLTQHKGVSKVQLSAIENEVLSPIKANLESSKAKIKNVYPLSWTTKSLISLEPSISIVQLGARVYLAQHYIGIDQTNDAEVADADKLVETVKTLKGAEPSIQTLYLVTSELAEEKLKTELEKVLPIQQLAVFKEDDSKMPSYVQKIIEAGMKSISIPDYKVPEFDMKKVKAAPITKKKEEEKPEDKDTELKLDEETPEEKKDEKKEESSDLADQLPKPTEAEATEEEAKTETEETKNEEKEEEKPAEAIEALPGTEEDEKKETEEKPAEEKKEEETATLTIGEEDKSEDKEAEVKVSTEKKDSSEIMVDLSSEGATISTAGDNDKKEEKKEEEGATVTLDSESDSKSSKDVNSDNLKSLEEVDLKQFSQDNSSKSETAVSTGKKVIKNKSGVSNMLKMFFVGLASFSATVAIGVGIGLGVLQLSNKEAEVESPVVEAPAETAPTEAPTPTPTEEPVAINKEDLEILVVNATTKSGYAGTIKTALTDNEYPNIDAGNAKGEYEEEGYFVLMLEEDENLVKALSEDSGLELEFAEGVETEDPKEAYDAVIVLAKED